MDILLISNTGHDMINNEMDMLDMLDRTRTKKHVYNYEMLTIFYRFLKYLQVMQRTAGPCWGSSRS